MADKPKKKRISTLAKAYDVSSDVLVGLLKEAGVTVKSAASMIASDTFALVKPALLKEKERLDRKEMAKAGHLPPQDKLEQLKELGARIYICGGSMDPFGVKKSDLIFDDVIVAEYLTFLEVMENADIQIFLQ